MSKLLRAWSTIAGQHSITHANFTSAFGYVQPRKKMTAENAMKITKIQTKLNAM